MNITDTMNTALDDNPLKEGESLLEAIFRSQSEKMVEYGKIEIKNGIGFALVADVPPSLDDRRWQYLFKDHAWRVTEELAEAEEALNKAQLLGGDDYNEEILHFREELIDALHFLAELCIITGYETPAKLFSREADLFPIEPIEGDYLAGIWNIFLKTDRETIISANSPGSLALSSPVYEMHKVTYHLGLMGNCFRNKPWKQSHRLTDSGGVQRNLILAMYYLVGACYHAGLRDPEEVAHFYFAKSDVNKFRIRSQY